LEVLGPEHEFSIADERLKPLPIVDKIIKDFRGRIVNFVKQPSFTFGKELQLHVMEIKPNEPFKSPEIFEETMQNAVLTMQDFLESKYHACFLGTGMHPLLRLEETGIWPHRHRQIYQAFSKIFDLNQHGWLNIQSFQLNLPYSNEETAVFLHNLVANVCAYLPAISASSPFYEGKLGEHVDSRLCFYMVNQREIPSIVGDVVPEYVFSLDQYGKEIIGKYSLDLARVGAHKCLLNQDWINSRGAVLRFDRKAIEIRIMDEQECIKSDVALSCFVKALLKGLTNETAELLPHELLVRDFRSIIHDGLKARVHHPKGSTARDVCNYYYRVAWKNASEEEKKYLPIIEKRIQKGSLSELIKENVEKEAQRNDFREAIMKVYLRIVKNLRDNKPFF
jgi:gamma-glutamyl:cysteine ligase YbdK (ATP-grasp superfamily)